MTCFWTDIVFATQECPAEDDDVFYLLIPDGALCDYWPSSNPLVCSYRIGGNCGYPMRVAPGNPMVIGPIPTVLPSELTVVSAVLFREPDNLVDSDGCLGRPSLAGCAMDCSYGGFARNGFMVLGYGDWVDPAPISTGFSVTGVDDLAGSLTLKFSLDGGHAVPEGSWAGFLAIMELSHPSFDGPIYARTRYTVS